MGTSFITDKEMGELVNGLQVFYIGLAHDMSPSHTLGDAVDVVADSYIDTHYQLLRKFSIRSQRKIVRNALKGYFG